MYYGGLHKVLTLQATVLLAKTNSVMFGWLASLDYVLYNFCNIFFVLESMVLFSRTVAIISQGNQRQKNSRSRKAKTPVDTDGGGEDVEMKEILS